MDYVLIGRFQPLHRAHQLLIQEALRVSNGPLTLFVGSANKSACAEEAIDLFCNF